MLRIGARDVKIGAAAVHLLNGVAVTPPQILDYHEPSLTRASVNEISRLRNHFELLIKLKLSLYALLVLAYFLPPLIQVFYLFIPIWALLFVFELYMTIRLLRTLEVNGAAIIALTFASTLSLLGIGTMIGIDFYAARRLREEYRRLDALDAHRALSIPTS